MNSHKAHNLAGWDAAVLDARRIVTRAQKCRFYQFTDGFDNYSTLSTLWETVSGSAIIGTSYRRFAPPAGLPGQGLYLPGGAYCRKNMLSNQATWIPRVAVYYPALPTVGFSVNVVGVLDNGSFQVNVVVTNSGALQIYRAWASPYTTLLFSSGPGVISPNTYYGIECEFTVASGTSGSAFVWVDGVQVIAVTAINTQETSNAYANQIQLADPDNAGSYWDDVRVWDNTGSTQNSPLGATGQDSRLVTKLPAGAGTNSGFTPNGAAANWQCEDDNPPDGDSTYTSAAYSGTGPHPIDDYTMPSAGFTAAPVMVVARAMARKDDGATRELQIGLLSGSSSVGVASQVLASSYAFFDGIALEDPNTLGAWTAAAADAAHFWKQAVL
jgi:hypothetical protein